MKLTTWVLKVTDKEECLMFQVNCKVNISDKWSGILVSQYLSQT